MLEILEVASCGGLQEIVGKVENEATGVLEKFVFPHLTWLSLYDLPQATHFCPAPFTLECPVLYCSNMELFPSANREGEGDSTSTLTDRQSIFSNLKAISKLKSLILDWKHISVLRPLMEDLNYLNEVRLIFNVDENEKPTLPIEMLEKAPNLQEMSIEFCSSLQIFLTPNSKIGEHEILGNLKILTLVKVSNLQSIGSNDSPWLNTICEKLHKLNVESCPDLTTLIDSTATFSFSYLKELHIIKCHGLQYLFTSSTATKVMHLELITVKECYSMEAIVTKEEGEITSDGIKFEQLDTTVLSFLSSLKCFYSGNDTLELLSLRQVQILQCPKMENFSLGSVDAKSFQGIQASHDLNENLVLHNDINSSVKKVFLLQDHLVVGDSPILTEIWLRSETVSDWCFRNLSSLDMESCEFLSNMIIPSHLLPFLRNLKKLQVRNCNSVKSIFGLSKMINMGSEGSQSLQFLEELHVEYCEELVEIVAKEEEATEEANQGLIIFSSMISLALLNLPNLRSIYSGMHIVEWPVLEKLQVLGCQMLNFFATEFQNSSDSRLEGQHSFPTDHEAFISLEKIAPRLETLSLGRKEAMMIKQEKLHVDLLVLDLVLLQCFDDESDEFPFAFCSKATFPSIKRLQVADSAFKEIFPSQTLNIGYTQIFSQLKHLLLCNLSLLESIGLEHSWVRPFLQNLEVLSVWYCDSLTNLTPSTVSFSNLKELSVYCCHGLKYLFTSSTANTLGVLWRMEVTHCDSIEETVASGEGEDEGEDEIIFSKLEILTLGKLPTLGSFYTGSSILNFPCLKMLSFTKCSSTKVFRPGDTIPNELKVTINEVPWEGDINSVIMQQFEVVEVAELV